MNLNNFQLNIIEVSLIGEVAFYLRNIFLKILKPAQNQYKPFIYYTQYSKTFNI